MMTDQETPQRRLEEYILACFLRNPVLMAEHPVHVEDFADWKHRAIFGTMRELADAGKGPDLLAVAAKLDAGGALAQIGGLPELEALQDQAVESYGLAKRVQWLRSRARMRRFGLAAGEVMVMAQSPDPDEDEVMQRARALLMDAATAGAGKAPVLMADAVAEANDHLQRVLSGDAAIGIKTGFRDLDDHIGALQPGDYVLIGGAPKMGKSALGLGIARNVAGQSGHVGVFSLEMRTRLVTQRLACADAKVAIRDIRNPEGTAQNQIARWQDALGVLAINRLWVDDRPGMTMPHIRSQCHRMVARHGPLDLVVIDYLQLMRGLDPRANQERRVGENSTGLVELAKEFNCVVIVVAQLNREIKKRADKRPELGDCRDSGQPEQDATLVLYVYRDEVYHEDSTDKGVAEIIVAAGRSVAPGTVRLKYDGFCAKFSDAERWH